MELKFVNKKEYEILRKKWKIADIKVLLDESDYMIFNAKRAKFHNLDSDLSEKIKIYLEKELVKLEKELDEVLRV